MRLAERQREEIWSPWVLATHTSTENAAAQGSAILADPTTELALMHGEGIFQCGNFSTFSFCEQHAMGSAFAVNLSMSGGEIHCFL